VLRLGKEVSIPGKNQEQRRMVKVKMRISVTIENEDGSAFVDPTTIEVGVPEVESFTSPQVFDQVFYQYEQAVIDARNGVVEEATENYLSAVGKKNAVGAREPRRRTD
jgi:hypothetical protein